MYRIVSRSKTVLVVLEDLVDELLHTRSILALVGAQKLIVAGELLRGLLLHQLSLFLSI
jgi:hypothetical protein